MFSWLADRLTGHNTGSKAYQMAEQLYAAIVAQARQPEFYRELSTADTVQGRFELICVHMFLVLDRLSNDRAGSREVAQQLVDIMFQDMDDVARETGVGDMGVGPRIKKLARSFRSRLEYYKQSIEGDAEGNYSRGTLAEAILEIHFKNEQIHQADAERLAKYMIGAQVKLVELSLEQMCDTPDLFGEFD